MMTRSKTRAAAKSTASKPLRRSKRNSTTTGTKPRRARQLAPSKKPSKRKATTTASKAKQRKTRLTGTVNTNTPLGVVDPQSNLDGDIVLFEGEPLDAMLVLVDPSKNMDKYYVIQMVQLCTPQDNGAFAVYTRWGRTGTSGQALTEIFENEDEARLKFMDTFEKKTGTTWDLRLEVNFDDKYRFIQQDFVAKEAGYANCEWQYWVDDGVDGKGLGWYPYDRPASCIVEQLFTELPAGGTYRLVHSGNFVYGVNLDNFTQTNTSTGTVRSIARRALNQTFTFKGQFVTHNS